MEANVNFHWTW